MAHGPVANVAPRPSARVLRTTGSRDGGERTRGPVDRVTKNPDRGGYAPDAAARAGCERAASDLGASLRKLASVSDCIAATCADQASNQDRDFDKKCALDFLVHDGKNEDSGAGDRNLRGGHPGACAAECGNCQTKSNGEEEPSAGVLFYRWRRSSDHRGIAQAEWQTMKGWPRRCASSAGRVGEQIGLQARENAKEAGQNPACEIGDPMPPRKRKKMDSSEGLCWS